MQLWPWPTYKAYVIHMPSGPYTVTRGTWSSVVVITIAESIHRDSYNSDHSVLVQCSNQLVKGESTIYDTAAGENCV